MAPFSYIHVSIFIFKVNLLVYSCVFVFGGQTISLWELILSFDYMGPKD